MATRQGPTGPARRWVGVLVMVGVATLGMAGCGGDSASNPLSGLLGVEMSFVPAEGVAVASDVEGFDWVVPYQVTLQETRGELGGTVTRFNVVVYEVVDDQAVEADPADSQVTLPSSRLSPGGTLDAAFETHYSLVSGGRTAFIEVTAFITDDAGLIGDVTGTLTVP